MKPVPPAPVREVGVTSGLTPVAAPLRTTRTPRPPDAERRDDRALVRLAFQAVIVLTLVGGFVVAVAVAVMTIRRAPTPRPFTCTCADGSQFRSP